LDNPNSGDLHASPMASTSLTAEEAIKPAFLRFGPIYPEPGEKLHELEGDVYPLLPRAGRIGGHFLYHVIAGRAMTLATCNHCSHSWRATKAKARMCRSIGLYCLIDDTTLVYNVKAYYSLTIGTKPILNALKSSSQASYIDLLAETR